MARDSTQDLRIFISHAHVDHDLAMTVRGALERLSRRIECFVSGADITAGTDWQQEIRANLVASHLLVLLFTRPSTTWDWCLYEAGLFTSLDDLDDRSVVSIYPPRHGAPRPLTNLQGIPAEPEALARFLDELCSETWRVARGWRLGPLAPRVSKADVAASVSEILAAFPVDDNRQSAHYTCHRVVLDLRPVGEIGTAIPEGAVVIEGDEATTNFTLSLFDLVGGARTRTWGELVAAVDGADTAWRRQLDERFAAALDERLFEPVGALMPAAGGHHHHREYRPVLYRILHVADQAASSGRGRPIEVILLFEPVVDR